MDISPMKKVLAFLPAPLITLPLSVAVTGCGDYTCPEGRCFGTADQAVVSPAATQTTEMSGSTTDDGLPPNTAPMPCDILSAAGIECVSAHSTVRVVVGGYNGPLYQVQRGDGTTLDINTINGYADASAQDAFCTDACIIPVIYDQSGLENHLTPAPPGQAKPTPGDPADAAGLPVQINGRNAYGILIQPGIGYRKLVGNGTAVADEPQTIYMVSSQHDLINGCCFDYGNAEITANNDGNGTMEAVYLGNGVVWGTGSGDGPWAMIDLENGLFAGWENMQDRNISTNTSLLFDFVTALVLGDTADKNEGKGRFAVFGGDATTGTLKTMYDGIRPERPGYVPAAKQGSVILGIGGDNSNFDGGRFYEGVMANGVASKATVDELQAAIVEAKYGK
jgi:non-reducing end alpha-L-arabinofuranosidase